MSTGLRLPRFLRYEQHVDLLVNRLAVAATSSRPQVVVIAGDTGTGKTRIVQELYRRLVEQRESEGSAYHVPDIGLAEIHRRGHATEALEQWRAAVFPPDHAVADPRQRPGFIWLGIHLAAQQQSRDDTMILELRSQVRTYRATALIRRGGAARTLEAARGLLFSVMRIAPLAGLYEVTPVEHTSDVVAAIDIALGEPVSLDAVAATVEDRRALVQELDEAIGFRGGAEESLPGRAQLTPVVLVIDDAHALGEAGAEALVDLLDGSMGARRPVLLVLTTWLHQLRDPGTTVNKVVRDLRALLVDPDATEGAEEESGRLWEIELGRTSRLADPGEGIGRLSLDDLAAIITESLPWGEGVGDREAIVAVLCRRLAGMPSTSARVAMRVCAEAVERLASNRGVDPAWAAQVDLALEPGLEQRYRQLAEEDRSLVDALIDHRMAVLAEFLDDDDRRRVADLVTRQVVVERSGTYRVAPELAQLIRELRVGAALNADPRGLLAAMAKRMPALCRRLLELEVGVASALAGIDLSRDTALLAAAPGDCAFLKVAQVLASVTDGGDGVVEHVSAADRAALLGLAGDEPALVAVMAEDLLTDLVQQGPAGDGFAFASDLAAVLLRGSAGVAGAPLVRRIARSLCVTVGLDDLVHRLRADEAPLEAFVEVALEHAERDVILMEALLRLAAAELVTGEQLARIAATLPPAVRRVPRMAREFLAAAPAPLREPIEAAVCEHLSTSTDLPLAASLLATSGPISPRTAAIVEDSVVRSLREFAAARTGEQERSGPDDRARGRQLIDAVRQLLKRRHAGDDRSVDELRQSAVPLVGYDPMFGLSLLQEASGDLRGPIWEALVASADGMDPYPLVRLLFSAASAEERREVLEVVRRRAAREPAVAVSWLTSASVRRSTDDVDPLHEEAFEAVEEHAYLDRSDLLAMLVRAAPDAARRQVAVEQIRGLPERGLELVLTLLRERILPDEPERVRELLRAHVDTDLRAALVLLRIAEGPADVALATASAARSMTQDPDAGVRALLDDPDPWITTLVSREIDPSGLFRQFRYRTQKRRWNAADHLAEMGLSPSAWGTSVLGMLAGSDGADRWGISAGARLALSHAEREEVRRAVRAELQEEGDTRVIRAAIMLFGPADPERAAAREALVAMLGARPGVAAMLAEEGVEHPDLLADLREEAVLDARSAVAMSRLDPEAAVPLLEARRAWHPPSTIAWARVRPDLARDAAGSDVLAATALALTVDDGEPYEPVDLPSDADAALLARVIDLLLEVEPDLASARLSSRMQERVLDALVRMVRSDRGLRPEVRRLLLELAGRVTEDRAEAALGRIAPDLERLIAPTLAWDLVAARTVVRARLHERLGSFDRFAAGAVMSATPAVLVELADIIPELERPDLREHAADRLRAMLSTAIAGDDLDLLARLAVAWARVAGTDDRFSKPEVHALEHCSDRGDVAAAVVRVGLDATVEDRRDEWLGRVVAKAEQGDAACLALLMRGDLVRAQPLEPARLAQLVADHRDVATLVAWVFVGEAFREHVSGAGKSDLVKTLDRAVTDAVRSDARAALALAKSTLSAYESRRPAARDRLVELSMRSSAIAGRTLLLLRPRQRRDAQGDARVRRSWRPAGPPTLLDEERDRMFGHLVDEASRDEHARMILGAVLVHRRKVAGTPLAALRRFRDLVRRRRDDCMVSAAVSLLVGRLEDLPGAADACRKHHITRPERFVRVLRALVPDLAAAWWHERVASIHETRSPLDRALREAFRIPEDVAGSEQVRVAREGDGSGDADATVETVRRLLAALGDDTLEGEERRRHIEELRALMPELLALSAARRVAAGLLADTADLLGHSRKVTEALLRWSDDDLLARAAIGVRDDGPEVPSALLDALRRRAPRSVHAAEALALVASGEEGREEGREEARLLVAARLERGTSRAARVRLEACLMLLGGRDPRSVWSLGVIPDDRVARIIAGEMLGQLPEASRVAVAGSLARGRELVGIRRAVPHLSRDDRSRAFLWVADLPQDTAGRTRLMLRLARSDSDIVRAKRESPKAAYRGAVAEAILSERITQPEHLSRLVPFGSAFRYLVLDELRRTSEGTTARSVTATLANVNLLIDGRRVPSIHAALYTLLQHAKSHPEAAVGLVDVLERMSDDKLPVSGNFRVEAAGTLKTAVRNGYRPAIVRAAVPSPAVGDRLAAELAELAAAVIDQSTALGEARKLVADDAPLAPEHLLDPDVQAWVRLWFRRPRITDGKLRKRVGPQRHRVLTAVERGWAALDGQARAAVLDALPNMSGVITDPDDIVEVFRASPQAVAPRLNRFFVEELRNDAGLAARIRPIIAEHARDHLACALALAQVGGTHPGEVRELLEPFRQHEPGLVLVALAARTHVATEAHTVMDRAGDPLVDQLVDILEEKFASAGSLRADEVWLFASLAGHLRPRHRSLARRALRRCDGFSPIHRLEILAQLAETPTNRSEVWAMTNENLDTEMGLKHMSLDRIVELARARPDEVDAARLRTIDQRLAGFPEAAAIDARIELRSDERFPDDGLAPELIREVLARAADDPYDAAVTVLRHAIDTAQRQRALAIMADVLLERAGARAFDRTVRDVSALLRDCEPEELKELLGLASPLLESTDVGVVHVFLGTAEERERALHDFMGIAAVDPRAARELGWAVVGMDHVAGLPEAGAVAEALEQHAPGDPELAALMLAVFARSGPQPATRVHRVAQVAAAAAQPEIFNEMSRMHFSGVWLVATFGVAHPFIWGLLAHLEGRSLASEGAAILAAELAPHVSPCSVPSARIALRTFGPAAEVTDALRRLDAAPRDLVDGIAYLPGPLGLRLFLAARAEGRLAELARQPDDDGVDPLVAVRIAARLEGAPSAEREAAWTEALRRVPDDWSMGWLLAVAELDADERQSVARVLRRRTAQGGVFPLLVARTLGDGMEEADVARLEERLRADAKRLLALLLLVDPDVTWAETMLADRLRHLGPGIASAVLAELRAGVELPQLVRLLAAADERRFVAYVEGRLGTDQRPVNTGRDRGLLEAIGRGVASAPSATGPLLETVADAVAAADDSDLDDVALLLGRRLRSAVREDVGEGVPRRSADGPVAAAEAWRFLARSLDLAQTGKEDAVRHLRTHRPEQVARLLPPGSLERVRAFRALQSRLSRGEADAREVAILLHLRRDLLAPGERFFEPPRIVAQVQHLIDEEDVLVEALRLPTSIVPEQHFIGLHPLLASLTTNLARGSLPVAGALVDVLGAGHPLAHRIPRALRSGAVELLVDSNLPRPLLTAMLAGEDIARERLLGLLEDGVLHAAAAVGRLWPLDRLDDAIARAAAGDPAGAVALDRRLRAAGAATDPEVEALIRRSLQRRVFEDLACVVQLLAGPDGPEKELARQQFPVLAAESGPHEVAEVCDALGAAGLGDDDAQSAIDALGSLWSDAAVTLAIVRAGATRGPLLERAAEALVPIAHKEPAVASLVLPLLGADARTGLLREPSASGAVEVAALAVDGLEPAEIPGIGKRVDGHLSGRGSSAVCDALACVLVRADVDTSAVFGALSRSAADKVRDHLNRLASEGSERASLAALRWSVLLHRAGEEGALLPSSVGAQLRRAAGGDVSLDDLRSDVSIAEVVGRWWGRVGFDSPVRDLIVHRSLRISARSLRIDATSTWTFVRSVGSMAVVRSGSRGILGLVPGSELMAALQPDREWQLGAALDGVVEEGAEVVLQEMVQFRDDVDVPVLRRPRGADEVRVEFEDGVTVAGLIPPRIRSDGTAVDRVVLVDLVDLPADRTVADRLVPQGEDPAGPLDRYFLLELPVMLRAAARERPDPEPDDVEERGRSEEPVWFDHVLDLRGVMR